MTPKPKSLPVIELVIDDDSQSGVDAISFVDNPAIDYTWQYFKKEEFVKPKEGESQKDYLSRCIAYVMNEGKEQDQACAECESMWKSEKMSSEGVAINAPNYVSQTESRKKAKVKKAFQKLLMILGETITSKFKGLKMTEDITLDNHDGTFECNYMFNKKLYTPDEVHEINQILQPYMNTEDIFTRFTGWKEVLFIKNKKTVSFVSQRDIEDEMLIPQQSFKFVAEDKRLIVSPVMVPNKLIYRKENGNEFNCYFTEDTIAKIAEKYSKNHWNASNLMHDKEEPNKFTIIESWFVEDPKFDKSAYYGFNLPKGTWVVIARVDDSEVWNKVKDGTFKGLSVGGLFGLVRRK